MKAKTTVTAVASLMSLTLCATSAFAQEAAPAEAASNALLELISDSKIELSGMFEFTASYFKQGDEKVSDFSLAEINLGFAAKLSDKLSAEIVLIYEDGNEDGVSVDSAIVTYQFSDELSFSAGRFTVPFGKFESEMLSDPLTLALGEISSDGIYATWKSGIVTVNIAAFDSAIVDSDTIETVAASIEIAPEDGFAFGFSVVSDLGGGAMADVINDTVGEGGSYSKAAGISAFAKATFGIATLSAEYVAAIDDMEITDAAGDTYAAKPQAWFAELALALCDDVTAAFRYEGSKEFLPEEMPENIFGATVKYAIIENATVGLEYMFGKVKDGDDMHCVTANFVVEF